MSVEKHIEENFGRTEGMAGVENLAMLCRDLGYEDPSWYGQFREKDSGKTGCLGDIFEFLQDNPGAIEAICTWIAEQRIPKWEELFPDEEEEEEEN